MPLPELPPAYNLVALDPALAAFARAVRSAPRGLDDGTVYWSQRQDRLDAALVLEPEWPADVTLEAVYVFTVAAGDALRARTPAAAQIAFAWPGHILCEGDGVGRVRAALAPVAGEEAVPPWLVLGLEVDLGRLGDGRLTASALVEDVGRCFLRWTGRWLDDGLAPVRAAWNRRCYRLGGEAELVLGGRRFAGPVAGLDPKGAFRIAGHRLDLRRHLASVA